MRRNTQCVFRLAVTIAAAFVLCTTTGRPASASSFSEVGSLSSTTDYVTFVLNLNFSGSLGLQTYGFGGGTNVAHDIIPAGGFDPFVALFAGTGPTATFLDGTSDGLSNYTSEPSACPPAGTVTLGSQSNDCGDVRLIFNGLAKGLYTILLSDAEYVPNAVFETNGQFQDGFLDFTPDALPFQTCDTSTTTCNTDTQNWALDILGPEGSTLVTPEPSAFAPTGVAILSAAWFALRRRVHRKQQF